MELIQHISNPLAEVVAGIEKRMTERAGGGVSVTEKWKPFVPVGKMVADAVDLTSRAGNVEPLEQGILVGVSSAVLNTASICERLDRIIELMEGEG